MAKACRGKFFWVTIFYGNQISRTLSNLKIFPFIKNCHSKAFASTSFCHLYIGKFYRKTRFSFGFFAIDHLKVVFSVHCTSEIMSSWWWESLPKVLDSSIVNSKIMALHRVTSRRRKLQQNFNIQHPSMAATILSILYAMLRYLVAVFLYPFLWNIFSGIEGTWNPKRGF